MKSPLVSILLPVYNSDLFLNDSINSLLTQSYKNIEIILIDDGSTDNTSVICEHYSKHDRRVKFYQNKTNLKLIKTLNMAISLASGELIARMDADDISSSDRIERMVLEFQKNPNIDLVACPFHFISDTNKILGKEPPKAFNSDALKFISFFCTPVCHPSILVKASVLKENYYDENFIHAEDHELFARMLKASKRFLIINDYLYKKRINNNSVSYKYEKEQRATQFKISYSYLSAYLSTDMPVNIVRVASNRFEDFNISADSIQEAFLYLNSFKEIFLKQEAISITASNEIERFVWNQKLDICIQAFKKSNSIRYKILIIFIALKNRILFKAENYTYLLVKTTNYFKIT